jgi:hypothetical protein
MNLPNKALNKSTTNNVTVKVVSDIATTKPTGAIIETPVADPKPFATGFVDLKRNNAFKRIYCDLDGDGARLLFYPSAFPRDDDSLYAQVNCEELKLCSSSFADTMDFREKSFILEWNRKSEPPRTLCATDNVVTLRCASVHAANNWAKQIDKAINLSTRSNQSNDNACARVRKEGGGGDSQNDILFDPESIVALGGHRKSIVNPRTDFHSSNFMSQYELGLGSHGGEVGRFSAEAACRSVSVVGIVCLCFSAAALFSPMWFVLQSKHTSLSVSMLGGKCESLERAIKGCHPRSWALVLDNITSVQEDLHAETSYGLFDFCSSIEVALGPAANSTAEVARVEVLGSSSSPPLPFCGVRPFFLHVFIEGTVLSSLAIVRTIRSVQSKRQDEAMFVLMQFSTAHLGLGLAGTGLWISTVHRLKDAYPATSIAVGVGPCMLCLSMLCSLWLAAFCGWQIRDALFDAIERTISPKSMVGMTAVTVYGNGAGLSAEDARVRGQSMANAAGWQQGAHSVRDPYARRWTYDSPATPGFAAASQDPPCTMATTEKETQKREKTKTTGSAGQKIVPACELQHHSRTHQNSKNAPKAIAPVDLASSGTGEVSSEEAAREKRRRAQRKRRRASVAW